MCRMLFKRSSYQEHLNECLVEFSLEKISDRFSKTYELLFEMICDSAAIFEHKICHRIPSEKYAIFLIVS